MLYEMRMDSGITATTGIFRREEYDELVTWLRGHSDYDTEIVPEYEDQILMLSTCSYHTKNGRFVVAARRGCGAVNISCYRAGPRSMGCGPCREKKNAFWVETQGHFAADPENA